LKRKLLLASNNARIERRHLFQKEKRKKGHAGSESHSPPYSRKRSHFGTGYSKTAPTRVEHKTSPRIKSVKLWAQQTSNSLKCFPRVEKRRLSSWAPC